MTNDTQTTNTETTDTYIPSPSDWVREQVETIEATGDTRSVDIMGQPAAIDQAFALHHLCHAHNMAMFGTVVDPSGVSPAVSKKPAQV